MLDANAIIRGSQDYSQGGFLTTPSVLGEIASPIQKTSLNAAIQAKNITLAEPSSDSLTLVEAAAEKIGESERLSIQDKEILALTLGYNAVLISDDYSIQNTARFLKIPVENTAQKPITESRTYGFRCESCRKKYPEKQADCPICGGTIVNYVKKRG